MNVTAEQAEQIRETGWLVEDGEREYINKGHGNAGLLEYPPVHWVEAAEPCPCTDPETWDGDADVIAHLKDHDALFNPDCDCHDGRQAIWLRVKFDGFMVANPVDINRDGTVLLGRYIIDVVPITPIKGACLTHETDHVLVELGLAFYCTGPGEARIGQITLPPDTQPGQWAIRFTEVAE